MTTLADLRTYCADQWGDRSSTKALRVFDRIVNAAHREIAQSNRWSYFRKEGFVKLQKAYKTGTVEMSNGSTTVVLTGGTWPTDAANGVLLVSGNTDVAFEVSSRASGTNLALSTAWIDSSGSGLTYNLYYQAYTPPTDFRTMCEGDLEDQAWIRYLTPSDFKRYSLASRNTSGQPIYYTIWGAKFRVYPYPTEDEYWQFDYSRWPTALSGPSDTMDWDEGMLDLMFAGIDMLISRKWKDYHVAPGVARAVYEEKLKDCRAIDASRDLEREYWRSQPGRRRQVAPTPLSVSRGSIN